MKSNSNNAGLIKSKDLEKSQINTKQKYLQ